MYKLKSVKYLKRNFDLIWKEKFNRNKHTKSSLQGSLAFGYQEKKQVSVTYGEPTRLSRHHNQPSSRIIAYLCL